MKKREIMMNESVLSLIIIFASPPVYSAITMPAPEPFASRWPLSRAVKMLNQLFIKAHTLCL